MKLNKRLKTILLFALSSIIFLVGLFYFAPFLFEKHYPPPSSPEWHALQKKFNNEGYLTEEDVKRMNKLGDDSIQQNIVNSRVSIKNR
ncbi:MAG: hypothetical protein ABL920_08640 [Methylotenera sp.]